jgi:hypothetical protein
MSTPNETITERATQAVFNIMLHETTSTRAKNVRAIILAAIEEAYNKGRNDEMDSWVKCRISEIKAGESKP